MGLVPMRTWPTITCLTICLMLPAPGYASHPPAGDASADSPLLLVQNGGISLQEAARIVRRQTGGRVLSANQVQRSGERWYEIRVLVSEGKVRVYRVDPVTGRMR